LALGRTRQNSMRRNKSNHNILSKKKAGRINSISNIFPKRMEAMARQPVDIERIGKKALLRLSMPLANIISNEFYISLWSLDGLFV
jgi:hypothetical protein